jgi:hypothetical protein
MDSMYVADRHVVPDNDQFVHVTGQLLSSIYLYHVYAREQARTYIDFYVIGFLFVAVLTDVS